MEHLLDDALASGLGSAAALAVGDAGVEVLRVVRGLSRSVPDAGYPIDERTLFDVASLTKPMSTVAIAMVLVGEGRLDLDAPVRRWIGGAATTGTVAQLLGHAAGCAAHIEFFREMRDSPSRTELVERAAAHPCGEPGVATIYSDLGYIQAGAVVERAAGMPLEAAFQTFVVEPLGLSAKYGPVDAAVSTEIDEFRGLVTGRVHDENAFYGGGVCGHAGVFASIDDVSKFARALALTLAGNPQGRLRTDVVARFVTTAMAPNTSWRLGWDTPSTTPGVSHAGDRWPREHAIGHLGFTGTSLWLDPPRRRWSVLLTNRVHPSRFGDTADRIKALRRAVNDAAIALTA
jgi:CubicO group peptidase (beta-lactamase class C family)